MAIRRHYNNNAAVVSTVGSMSNVATTVTVTDASTFPATYPWTAIIDAGLATAEVVLVTAATGALLTITRGYDGTAAQTHASAATFAHVAVQADYDEANSHVVATSAVHGVSGTIVGTTDVQTLTNKTVASPILTGTLSGAGVISTSGNITTTAAVTATGTVTGGNVSTAGNVTATGNLVSSAGNVTASAGTVTGKTVTGAVLPTTFTNEAAATAALTSPATNTMVWLTTPTGGGLAGPYTWNGTAWAPMRAWSAGDTGLLGSSAALATAGTSVATPGSVTFTLPVQSLVRIDGIAQFEMLTGTTGRYYVRPAYNSGASIVLGSAIGVGFFATTMVTVTGVNGMTTATSFGLVTLAAGQYTAYGLLNRAAGGGATDIAQSSEVTVTVYPV